MPASRPATCVATGRRRSSRRCCRSPRSRRARWRGRRARPPPRRRGWPAARRGRARAGTPARARPRSSRSGRVGGLRPRRRRGRGRRPAGSSPPCRRATRGPGVAARGLALHRQRRRPSTAGTAVVGAPRRAATTVPVRRPSGCRSSRTAGRSRRGRCPGPPRGRVAVLDARGAGFADARPRGRRRSRPPSASSPRETRRTISPPPPWRTRFVASSVTTIATSPRRRLVEAEVVGQLLRGAARGRHAAAVVDAQPDDGQRHVTTRDEGPAFAARPDLELVDEALRAAEARARARRRWCSRR